MSDTTTTSKTRTITLTDLRPVKIQEDQWPVIAVGSADDDDSQTGNRPNRTWTRTIRVRQHADGRAIVYGIYDYETAFSGESGAAARRGTLLSPTATPDQIVTAIRDVGSDLVDAEEAAAIDPAKKDAFRWRAAIQACIADLPAVEL